MKNDKLNWESNLYPESLVSIIMPTYNCETFIAESIDSVIAQTYKNWELIIIDDCSTDKTEDVVKKYLNKDNRIKYYKLETNSGAAIARNIAVDHARGKYMAFLDSDDIWLPEKLSKQVAFMQTNNYIFTSTGFAWMDESGEDMRRIVRVKKRLDYHGVLKHCPGIMTVMYDVDALGKFKTPDIRKRNDYVLWLKVIKKAKYLYGMQEILARYRIRTGSLSRNKFTLVKYQWQVYREIEKIPVVTAASLIIYFGIKDMTRKILNMFRQ